MWTLHALLHCSNWSTFIIEYWYYFKLVNYTLIHKQIVCCLPTWSNSLMTALILMSFTYSPHNGSNFQHLNRSTQIKNGILLDLKILWFILLVGLVLFFSFFFLRKYRYFMRFSRCSAPDLIMNVCFKYNIIFIFLTGWFSTPWWSQSVFYSFVYFSVMKC